VSYAVLILRRAQRELADVPRQTYERVKVAMYRLGEDPRPRGCRKLTGRDGWRIRVGVHRIIYEIDDAERVVTILQVGHRRDIYD
jgi:mRNA interferase RelE/StbE